MKRTYGSHTIELKNLDKLYFRDDGIDKGRVIEHYERVAEPLLRHAADHPLSLKRFPDGIDKQGFFQKNSPDYYPEWVRTVEVPKKGGSNQHVVLDNKTQLVYLANQGTIEFHAALSRSGELDVPDRMVFDLDPSTDDFKIVKRAAASVREVLDEIGLPCYLQTSGSRGLHVVVPLRPTTAFNDVRSFSHGVAQIVVRRDPDRFTLEPRKKNRGDRLLIDFLRNGFAATTVCSYSLRALPGAPVATPLDWDELDDKRLAAGRYTLGNIAARLDDVGDPWKGMSRRARDLGGYSEKLDRLLDDV